MDITETSPQGEGIARIQGLVVRVADAKPGVHVKIRVTRSGGMTAKAEIANSLFVQKLICSTSWPSLLNVVNGTLRVARICPQ